MVVYSVLLFVLAALTVTVEVISLLQGGRDLTCYDLPIRVKGEIDLRAYNFAQNIVRLCMSIPLIACGVLMLIQPEIPFALIGLGVLVLGVIGGYVASCLVRKKYTGRF